MFGTRLDGIDPAPLALVEVGGRKQVADGEDSGERRADLVGEHGQRGLDHAAGGFVLERLRARPAGMRFFAGRFLLRDFTAMIPLQTPGVGFTMAWPDGRSHGGVCRCTPGNLR